MNKKLGIASLFVLAAVCIYLSSCTKLAPPGVPAPSPVDTSPPTEVGISLGSPTPSKPVADIMGIVQASPCRSYSWKDRGKAPIGYTVGMARAFQKSICAKRPVAGAAIEPKNTDKDALALYNVTQNLVNTYTLLMGLGMRESSGNYGEGFDTSAGPETSSTAETGLFQFSFNSIAAHPALRDLYTEYQKSADACMLSVFSQGAPGSHQGIVGTGPGADFQAFTKRCPAFAAEYAAVLIRVLRRHFGPLNTQKAEFNTSCQKMFQDIQDATVCLL